MKSLNLLLGMIVFVGVSLGACSGFAADAAPGGPKTHIKKFVNIAPHNNLYVDYQTPGAGKPTLVLINGLDYTTESWDLFVAQFAESGYGILRFDMNGQGRTLDNSGTDAAIPVANQVDDLEALLVKLNITQPIELLGLSYGGAVAMQFAVKYPAQVNHLMLMSTYLAPIAEEDQWIRMQIQNTRIMFPFNPASYEDLYEYFLQQLIFATVPFQEKVYMSPTRLEGIYRLASGIRKFQASDVSKDFPAGKTHLMIGRDDELIPPEQDERFWSDSVPKTSRASMLEIIGCAHRMPEVAPKFSAGWVKLIVENDARLMNDAHFVGDQAANSANGGGTLIISNVGNK